MTKLEELNDELKSIGFTINDDEYIFDNVTYSTVIVNGQAFKQPNHNIIKMVYLGECCELDDSDQNIEGTEFYNFMIVGNSMEESICVCVHDADEMKEMIGVN